VRLGCRATSEVGCSAVRRVEAEASRALKIQPGRPPGAALLPAGTARAAVLGRWLVAATVSFVLPLAIYSWEFRSWPAWEVRPGFGAGLPGAALPFVIVPASAYARPRGR
jgi:hypothetical protein